MNKNISIVTNGKKGISLFKKIDEKISDLWYGMHVCVSMNGQWSVFNSIVRINRSIGSSSSSISSYFIYIIRNKKNLHSKMNRIMMEWWWFSMASLFLFRSLLLFSFWTLKSTTALSSLSLLLSYSVCLIRLRNFFSFFSPFVCLFVWFNSYHSLVP